MTQTLTTTRTFASNTLTSSPRRRGPFVLRLSAAYAEYRSIQRLSAEQLADVGMTAADRNAITLRSVLTTARG